MRHTELPEEVGDNSYLKLNTQGKLDAFWNFIENHFEEDWKIAFNGDVILTVDDEFLEEILTANYAEAYLKFGTWRGGRNAEGESFLLDMPLYLRGTYIIKGIYNANQKFINGTRTYFFEPEV